MKDKLYAPSVLHFVATVTQYCALFDPKRSLHLDQDTLDEVTGLLATLYGAALQLPPLPYDAFESLEVWVTEGEYERVRQRLASLFGADDVFLEAELHDMQYSDTPIAVSLSEQMADLYQLFADAMWVFRQQHEPSMMHAIGELAYTFRTTWGLQLLTILRQLHQIAVSYAVNDDPFDEDLVEIDPAE